MVATEIIVSKKLEKVIWTKNLYVSLMLRCSKKLKSIFEMISNKNQPIKPKISSVENKEFEKIIKYMNMQHKRHLEYLRHFEKSPQTKIYGIYEICM
jgi:hypothetical protein